MNQCSKLKGFTLIEMAVVLVILGLVMSGMLMPLTAQIDQKNYTETRQHMGDIQEALIGYGLSHGYLPCPAVSSANGSEDRDGDLTSPTYNQCLKRSGFLPWAELGVQKVDNWGHLYGYSVTLAFSNANQKITLSPLTSRDITIRGRNSTGGLINLSNLNNIPATIVSFGKNGLLATNDDGSVVANTSLTNLDEVVNASGTTSFISRDYTNVTTVSGGEFDDVVVWLSPNLYLNRMISAGQLP